MSAPSFLAEPEPTPESQASLDEDVAELGFVMNASRLWAYQPGTHDALFDVMNQAFRDSSLSFRHRGLLVLATASTLHDSYCSLAWGHKMALKGNAESAASVLSGTDATLTDAEAAMVTWARMVVADPNGTSQHDVQRLRDAGFTDRQIFAITLFVSLRMAFSSVNDALGARPDHELLDLAPDPVVSAVSYGRRPA